MASVDNDIVLTELAKLVISFERLQIFLTGLINNLAEKIPTLAIKPEDRRYYKASSIQKKLKKIFDSSVVREMLSAQEVAAFLSILEKFKILSDIRNSIVHSDAFMLNSIEDQHETYGYTSIVHECFRVSKDTNTTQLLSFSIHGISYCSCVCGDFIQCFGNLWSELIKNERNNLLSRPCFERFNHNWGLVEASFPEFCGSKIIGESLGEEIAL